jgi:hypothetical protein
MRLRSRWLTVGEADCLHLTYQRPHFMQWPLQTIGRGQRHCTLTTREAIRLCF